MHAATKAFLCNATWENSTNHAFAAALSLPNAPNLKRLCAMAPLNESALNAGNLRLSEITAVGASWSTAGTALYCYTRRDDRTIGETAVVIDPDLDKVASSRRSADVQAHEHGATTHGEMERGLLRTAMMSAFSQSAAAAGM